MTGARAFVAGGLLAVAWFGRGLIVPDEGHGDDPFVPIARHVESDPVDLDWTPTDGVRDPFAPIELPSVG